jgi:NADH-quinone oxidoreductase subunit C
MLTEKIKTSLAGLELAKVAEADYSRTGCHLEVLAAPEQVEAIARALQAEKCFLESMTALDLVETFELVYHYASFFELGRTVVHVPLAKGSRAPSIAAIFPAADWFEREVFDMFGIKFIGHPNLKRLLLPEDADFYPLRKDFVASS